MRKTLRFVKRNIFGFLLGIIFCSFTVVLAESIQSEEVLYDNSNSFSNKDNVQDALDNLYNIVDHSGVAFTLLERNPSKLSNELVAGLYRYQGVQNDDNNVDNYICFGTTNKSDCVSDTDRYMYRIIGINPSGQMKLIKKEALNTAYAWNNSTGVSWPNSQLFMGLNGSYYLTNTTYVPDITWSNRIETNVWKYGDVDIDIKNPEITSNIELSFNSTINAKIGLMYIHDYEYSLPGGSECYGDGDSGKCKTSWIFMLKNDSNPPGDDRNEWLMTRNKETHAWLANWANYGDGRTSIGWLNYINSVRPVFFLRASERIASGSGTLTDPYILS